MAHQSMLMRCEKETEGPLSGHPRRLPFWNIAILLGAFFVLGTVVGYWRGSIWANLQSYSIGFDAGYNTGISDADATIRSGGQIIEKE